MRDTPIALNNLGHARYLLGDLSAAFRLYAESGQLVPDHHALHGTLDLGRARLALELLAEIREDSGDRDEASRVREVLRRAREDRDLVLELATDEVRRIRRLRENDGV